MIKPMAVFKKYANYYDLFYQDKDYQGEVDLIIKTFRKYSPKRRVKTILNLGCGTGNHDFILAGKGYKVTAVDGSADMIKLAKEKNKLAKHPVNFIRKEIQKLSLRKQFDAVISMFAVFSYLTKNEDLVAGIKTAHRHLKKGGLFIFDVWFGPAVLNEKPETRVKIFTEGKESILRLVSSKLNVDAHTVDVHYHIIHRKNKEIVNDLKETHTMRFFFPQELRHYLEENGFEMLALTPFGQLTGTPTMNDWNVSIVAKKK